MATIQPSLAARADFFNSLLNDRQMQDMIAQGIGHTPERLCWMVVHGSAIAGHAQLCFDWRSGVARLGRVAVAPDLPDRP
jgi:hypothetical protein